MGIKVHYKQECRLITVNCREQNEPVIIMFIVFPVVLTEIGVSEEGQRMRGQRGLLLVFVESQI